MILFRIWCPVCSRKCGSVGVNDILEDGTLVAGMRMRTNKYVPDIFFEGDESYELVCPGPHDTENGRVVDLVLRVDAARVWDAVLAARRGEKVKVVPTVVNGQ